MSPGACCIYEGAVRHRRFEVRRREFRHRLALAYLDLDELPALLDGKLVDAGPGLARFRRSDHLGDSSLALIYGHALVLKLKGVPVHAHPLKAGTA